MTVERAWLSRLPPLRGSCEIRISGRLLTARCLVGPTELVFLVARKNQGAPDRGR